MKQVFQTTLLALTLSTVWADNTIIELDKHKVHQLTQEAGEVKSVSHSNPIPVTTGQITYTGQEAIDFLGTKLPKVAEQNHHEPEGLKQILLSDPTLKVDQEGNLLYVDEIPASTSQKDLPNTVVFNGDATKLHSKPGAKKVIYLDTDGFDASQTVWGYGYHIPTFLPWSVSPDQVYQMWTMVAEDYAPFDVDVTTEEPSWDLLLKSDYYDEYYGARVVLTDTGTTGICSSCGGIAYLSTYDRIYPAPATQNTYQPALVFGLLGSAKNMAEAASHEAGHVLSLHHDGYNDGTTSYGYYSGTSNWAPIMGVGYSSNSVQWSKGEYYGANNQEDDLAIIATYLSYRTDNVADTLELATGLEPDTLHLQQTNIKEVNDIIETNTDIDLFTFTSVGGPVSFQVKPHTINASPEQSYNQSQRSNLRAKLELLDESGTVIATGTYPTNYYDTHTTILNTTIGAGKFYLRVGGTDYVTASRTEFTKYASLGQYTLSGAYTSELKPNPPVAHITSSILSGVGPFTVHFDGTTSEVGYGSTLRYNWEFGDGSTDTSATPVHTFNTIGTTEVELTVYNDADLTDKSTVQVSVTLPSTGLARISSNKITAKYNKPYNFTTAYATVKVINELKKPISYAQVCGRFTGTLADQYQDYNMCGQANKSGVAKISLNYGMQGKAGTIIFTVTNVTSSNPNLVYDKLGSLKASTTLVRK